MTDFIFKKLINKNNNGNNAAKGDSFFKGFY